MNNIIKEEVKDIKIEEIPIGISNGLLKTFEKYNIKTLNEIIDFANSSKLKITQTNEGIRDELNGLARLLKCKYYNEDPMIDLQDSKIVYNLTKMGFSRGSYNSLVRNFHTNEYDTFEKYLDNAINHINSSWIHGIGKEKKYEIISKINIVLNYYKNKDNNNITVENNTEGLLELVSLNEELKELIAKRNELDSQINILVNRIKDKTEEIGKGSK